MNIIAYAVISYDTNTERELNIAGWSDNESEARELESQLNDLSDYFSGEMTTPLIEYHTEPIRLYGATAEHSPYGDFDALIRNGIFLAIVPAGQGEHYRYLLEGADAIHCTNLLKGLDSYLA